MGFKDEYTTAEKLIEYNIQKAVYELKPSKDKDGNTISFPSAPKIIISNDAFAVGDAITELIRIIKRIAGNLK